MDGMTADVVAASLSRSMASLDDDERRLALAIYRLLATGDPVRPASVARVAGLPRPVVDAALEEWPGVFRDDIGRVVGFWGLALPEMPHRMEVDGVLLHAWCAWDALFLPALIGATARIGSACPVTGRAISLTVSAEGVRSASPRGAVVSMLMPAGGFDVDVIQSFCHHVHFIASREAGERWLADREDAFLLSVPEAFRLGELWNRHRFGAAGPPGRPSVAERV